MLSAFDGIALEGDAERLPKDMFNSLIGMMIAADEPHLVSHWSGKVLAERPHGFWREVDLGMGRGDFISEIEL